MAQVARAHSLLKAKCVCRPQIAFPQHAQALTDEQYSNLGQTSYVLSVTYALNLIVRYRSLRFVNSESH